MSANDSNWKFVSRSKKCSVRRRPLLCRMELLLRWRVTAASHNVTERPSGAPADTAEVLLAFGTSMLRAGNTASRTRKLMDELACKMDYAVSMNLSLDSVTINLCRAGVSTTAIREMPAPGVDISRIIALEKLARSALDGVTPDEIAATLREIDTARPRYPRTLIVAAVATASASFAFLNGAVMPEMVTAAISGGGGQALRSCLARRHFNQYAIVALTAVTVSGIYVIVATLAAHAGADFTNYPAGFINYPAGFIASVLFLVPGIPLIGGLFDLLHYQTLAAVSRLVYGAMILLAVAFGLSIVVELRAIDLSQQPPLALDYPVTLLLRAIASFLAAGSLAMLFNSPLRIAFATGVVAVLANDLRLLLIDFGITLAAAAFIAALAIGLMALLAEYRFKVPLLATTAGATVIMVPGVYAFKMIMLFNRNEMLDGLQAAAVCGFVVGALAMGLATARLFAR
ncbi:MAG TPA: threonine/serine exporter family protein [Xanthobacteraceae bacterium]